MRLFLLTCVIVFCFIQLVGSQVQTLCRFNKESLPSFLQEGDEAVYAVDLQTQPPTGVNVSIILTPMDSRVTFRTDSVLSFNASNWDQKQRFILFGVNDDDILDSPYPSQVLVESYSNSLNFSTFEGGTFPNANITLLLQDSDRAGADVTIEDDSGSSAIPEGRFSIYQIQIPSIPRANVTLQLSPVQPTIYLSEYTFIFHAGNWNISQAFAVFSVDDEVNQGLTFQSNISFTFTSADPYYSGLVVDEFPVLIEDNDEDSAVLTGVITWIQSDDRYGTEITLSLSLDRYYFPSATQGDIVLLEGAKLDFGDGSSIGPNIELNVTKLYSTNLLASLTISQRYSSACNLDGTPWSIQFSYCCRSKDLIVNGFTTIILESEVNLAEHSSSMIPLFSPLYVRSNSSTLQYMYLPVISSNGHPMQFSLPFSQAYISSQAGAPSWIKIDENTGLITFNTAYLPVSTGSTCFLVDVLDVVADLKTTFQLCQHMINEYIPSPVLLNYNFTNAITTPRVYYGVGETVELEFVVTSQLSLTIEPINPPTSANYASINSNTLYTG
ncbi:hypothetical protein LOD99_2288 [Oopsacas minuta]|uniref:Uncharacterized protein n=1 Tax=Oopsacas minuta TaxID=111878 RepID=A0AAV7K2Q5_9METZ|nr:hypothetical protein LOD99_2288 [Oopsacas minuta]